MLLALSETFKIITPESAEDGDVAESGLIRESEPVRVREVIEAFRECSEVSCYPVRPDTCAHVWASTAPNTDYRTGAEESRAFHVSHVDGRPLSSRAMFRILRAAGHADGRL